MFRRNSAARAAASKAAAEAKNPAVLEAPQSESPAADSLPSSTPTDPQSAAVATAEPTTASEAAEKPAEEPEPQPAPVRGGGGRGGRRSAYADKDLTEGSIPKNLWFMAWPQAVNGALRTADQLVDLFWAGFIDLRAVAGIGISQNWASMFNTGRTGMDTAQRALISRAMGAKNVELANHLAMQSIILNSVMSLSWIIPGFIFAEPLLRVLGVSDGLVDQTLWYMRFRFLGSFPFMLVLVTSSALTAAGDPLTPLRAQTVQRILNISLMPIFVFGVWILPEMGIAGTGFAFLCAQIPATLINFRALFKGTSRLHLHFSDAKIDLKAMWRQLKIGLPASVTGMERSLAQILVVGLVAPFGDVALAAYSLTQRMNQLINLGHAGLGSATGVLVGQNLGAGKPERAKETVQWAMLLTIATSLVIGGAMFIYPKAFLIIFTRDQELLEVASGWTRIMAVGFLAAGLGTVFVQAINTAGDTIIPMIVTLATIWLVQQPMAAFLSGQADDWALLGLGLPFGGPDLGSYGVAWAMVIAQAVRLFIYYPYYLTGRWMRKQIL
ncbi:MAG: MATE family efflux transporter [Dehalococcoidia bacterium]|nr:MATE family efflux transporter [Dehalococcoidia bacterium]